MPAGFTVNNAAGQPIVTVTDRLGRVWSYIQVSGKGTMQFPIGTPGQRWCTAVSVQPPVPNVISLVTAFYDDATGLITYDQADDKVPFYIVFGVY